MLEEKLMEKYGYGIKVPIFDFMNQEDKDLIHLAQFVYEKIYKHYSMKQWGCSLEELGSSVKERIPIFISKDDGFFQDKYQGIPLEGYTETIRKMLESPLIDVMLGVDYKKYEAVHQFDRIFYTGSIDDYYGYRHGQLPYRSVRFSLKTINKEHFQSNAVINHPCDGEYTRIHEYKYYLNDHSDKTVIAEEYPESFVLDLNERFYPIDNGHNRNLYDLYRSECTDSCTKVVFLGRLGDYRYYNMDESIKRAMEIVDVCDDTATYTI
jgi:UDP-galactopyranose mutase